MFLLNKEKIRNKKGRRHPAKTILAQMKQDLDSYCCRSPTGRQLDLEGEKEKKILEKKKEREKNTIGLAAAKI